MRTRHVSLFGIAALAALTAAPLAAADTAMSRHRDLRTPPTDLGDNGMMSIDNGLDDFGAGSAPTSIGRSDSSDLGSDMNLGAGSAVTDDTVGHARLGT